MVLQFGPKFQNLNSLVKKKSLAQFYLICSFQSSVQTLLFPSIELDYSWILYILVKQWSCNSDLERLSCLRQKIKPTFVGFSILMLKKSFQTGSLFFPVILKVNHTRANANQVTLNFPFHSVFPFWNSVYVYECETACLGFKKSFSMTGIFFISMQGSFSFSDPVQAGLGPQISSGTGSCAISSALALLWHGTARLALFSWEPQQHHHPSMSQCLWITAGSLDSQTRTKDAQHTIVCSLDMSYIFPLHV